MFDSSYSELFLCVEVVEERTFGDSGRRAKVIDCRRVKALGADERDRRFQ